MGGLVGGPKLPKIDAPPPPPPPPTPAAPPTIANPQVTGASQQAAARARAAAGVGGTIVTGPQGLSAPPPTAPASLLGGAQ